MLYHTHFFFNAFDKHLTAVSPKLCISTSLPSIASGGGGLSSKGYIFGIYLIASKTFFVSCVSSTNLFRGSVSG